MLATFDRFNVELPAAEAIALARLNDRDYQLAVDIGPLEGVAITDIDATLTDAHMGDHGDELERRQRMIYLAARTITNSLRILTASEVMSHAKYQALREACSELLAHHLARTV